MDETKGKATAKPKPKKKLLPIKTRREQMMMVMYGVPHNEFSLLKSLVTKGRGSREIIMELLKKAKYSNLALWIETLVSNASDHTKIEEAVKAEIDPRKVTREQARTGVFWAADTGKTEFFGRISSVTRGTKWGQRAGGKHEPNGGSIRMDNAIRAWTEDEVLFKQIVDFFLQGAYVRVVVNGNKIVDVEHGF